MKNIRINYKALPFNISAFKQLMSSFSSSKYNITFKVYDYSRGEPYPSDGSFLYKKMPYEDYSTSNDLILKEAKDDGVNISTIINDNLNFIGNIDSIIDKFDEVTGSVYCDYVANDVYFYLKSPPVKNMTAVLMFVDMSKVKSDKNIVETVFSSYASRHIPEGHCSVKNE